MYYLLLQKPQRDDNKTLPCSIKKVLILGYLVVLVITIIYASMIFERNTGHNNYSKDQVSDGLRLSAKGDVLYLDPIEESHNYTLIFVHGLDNNSYGMLPFFYPHRRILPNKVRSIFINNINRTREWYYQQLQQGK